MLSWEYPSWAKDSIIKEKNEEIIELQQTVADDEKIFEEKNQIINEKEKEIIRLEKEIMLIKLKNNI